MEELAHRNPRKEGVPDYVSEGGAAWCACKPLEETKEAQKSRRHDSSKSARRGCRHSALGQSRLATRTRDHPTDFMLPRRDATRPDLSIAPGLHISVNRGGLSLACTELSALSAPSQGKGRMLPIVSSEQNAGTQTCASLDFLPEQSQS